MDKFVIKRTDEDTGTPTVTHDTSAEATIEAERLARKHIFDNAVFTVYKLVPVLIVSAKVDIKVRAFKITDES